MIQLTRSAPFGPFWPSPTARASTQQTYPSALSKQDFRVDALKLEASVPDLHAPVDPTLARVDVRRPSGDLSPQRLQIADPPSAQALPRHRDKYVFGDVQPAAMIGRVAELDAPYQLPWPGRLERLVKGPLVCVLRVFSTNVSFSQPALVRHRAFASQPLRGAISPPQPFRPVGLRARQALDDLQASRPAGGSRLLDRCKRRRGAAPPAGSAARSDRD